MIRRCAAAVLICASAAFGAVEPGENILENGTLEADQTEYPVGWSIYIRDRKLVKWMPSGGPDALPHFRFASSAPEPQDTSVRQGGLSLVTNGTYRLSVRVRTKNFSYKHAGAVIAATGWHGPVGIKNVPKDTDGKWVTLSRKITPIAHGGKFQIILYASGFTGTFDVADAKLVAVNAAALKGTAPSALAAAANTPRFVPFSPLLWEIPKSRREVEFRFFGKVPSGKIADYDLVLTVDGGGESRIPVTDGAIRVTLPEGADRGVMTVRGVERARGQEICSERFTFRTVDAPAIPESCGRRLNNLSVELVSAPLGPGGGARRFAFSAPRGGWLYIAARRRGESRVTLDGREVIGAGTPRMETFREVEAGPHEVVAEGAGEGRMVVRAIADMFSYSPGGDWAYEERHVLPAVTTENGGRIPAEELPSFHARGYRWIANLNTTGRSAASLEKAIAECSGMTAPEYAGVTCDEQFFVRPHEIDEFQKGLKSYDLANSPERVIYTWIVGKPVTPSLDQAFIATCINASRGRGKILLETYCRTCGGTEEDARAHLLRYVVATLDRYREWYPLSVASACVAFGNFNKMPVLTLAHHPEVDYKYYLDMQLNLAANHPSCRGLGSVGYWGCGYADDEMRRWSSALMRHYVVEGHTNMLSSAYGYSYRPGHLSNGDFEGSLGPWRAEGDVRIDSYPEFAKRSQCRWGGNGGVGDTFAVLVRGENSPSSISQTARGLVPGRTYCLQFAAFDVKDVKANRVAPRDFRVSETLGNGAEVRKDLSWVYVDRRRNGRYDFNNGVARICLHHVVFTATAAETDIVLSNAAASPGEELGVNAVSLNPYFEGSAGDMAR